MGPYDIPDAPWIREAETYGADGYDDEYSPDRVYDWAKYNGAMPFSFRTMGFFDEIKEGQDDD